MLTPLRIMFSCIATPVFLLTVIIVMAVDDTPFQGTQRQLSTEEVQRAKQILNTSAREAQRVKTIELSEDDLNIASNYLLNHLIQSATHIVLNHNSLYFTVTLTLPPNIFGRYVNLAFNLNKGADYPVIDSLSIGKIRVPPEFAGQLIETVIKYTALNEYYILAAQHISQIHIHPDKLSITYLNATNDPSGNPRLQDNTSYQALTFYQQQIDQIISNHDPDWLLSLADLIHPLFLAAYQRSTEANAVAENRAALLAISSYVNQEELSAYLPINPNKTKTYPVYLYKRIDMAKHFTASAALAASGSISLAQKLGQEKEINDAQHGSGFSFIDLAGDRAGMKFGQTATASAKSARKLQKALYGIRDYRSFMPNVLDLPENISQQEFQQRYESTLSPAYHDMMQLIDERIDTLPIYQENHIQQNKPAGLHS